MSKVSNLLGVLLIVFGTSFSSAQSQNACAQYFTPATQQTTGVSGFSYYWNKFKEIKELDRTAPDAIFLRALIMTTTTEVRNQMVPLRQLKLIHPITRGASLEKLDQRTRALQSIFPDPDGKVALTSTVLSQILPSKNAMRVVVSEAGEYVVFDGNGRLVAIQNAFGDKMDNVTVEVEVFFSTSTMLQSTLQRIRAARNVL